MKNFYRAFLILRFVTALAVGQSNCLVVAMEAAPPNTLLASVAATASPPTKKPDPKALSMPKVLLINSRPVFIDNPGQLEPWWNAGPYPSDLPGMNAKHLADRLRAAGPGDRDLMQQIQAWAPIAAQWKAVYDYQVATNPPPRGIPEWQAKGYKRTPDGQYVREGAAARPPKGNFTAPTRAELMQVIIEKAEELGLVLRKAA